MAWGSLVAVFAAFVGLSSQFPASDQDDYIRLLLALHEQDPGFLDRWGPKEADMCYDEVLADENWPYRDLQLGQISGVAVDKAGNPAVSHRGSVEWTPETRLFNENNSFIAQNSNPIEEPTLVLLDAHDGSVIFKWGQNRFYLPHGLTIDMMGNYWLTDVALHQVFKFAPGAEEPSLTLGKTFEPATDNLDQERFCKPTDVAVASNGDIYVADGYCSSRVVRFDESGRFIEVIGTGDFWIPHSVVLAEELELMCVADRENMSIACYNIGEDNHGKLARRYTDPKLGRVFALSYLPTEGLLFGVTGITGDLDPQGFTLALEKPAHCDNDFLSAWSPESQRLTQPHDVAVSPDGDAVYVSEIGPNKLWKFERP